MKSALALIGIMLIAPDTYAEKACLGEIESQILPLAEAQVRARGEEIRQSRVTIMHNYGCTGGEPLECTVESRVAVESESRVWSHFSFQSTYAIGSKCSTKGNVKSVQVRVLDGEAARDRKNVEDRALLDLLSK